MSDHPSERRVDLLAREFALNINSLTTRQLLDHRDMRVDAFINAFRRAGIRGEFPAELLEMTVEEALRSRHATVRKLLIDRRFAK